MPQFDPNILIDFLKRGAGATGQDFPDIPRLPTTEVGFSPEGGQGPAATIRDLRDWGAENKWDAAAGKWVNRETGEPSAGTPPQGAGDPFSGNSLEANLSNLMRQLVSQQAETFGARRPLRDEASRQLLDPGMLDVGPDIGAAFADPTNPFATQFNSRDLIQGARGFGGAPGAQTPTGEPQPQDPMDFTPFDPVGDPINPAGPVDRPRDWVDLPPIPPDQPVDVPAPRIPETPRDTMPVDVPNPEVPIDLPPMPTDQRPLNPKRDIPIDVPNPPDLPPIPLDEPRLDGPPPAEIPVDLPPAPVDVPAPRVPRPTSPVNPKRLDVEQLLQMLSLGGGR